MDLNEIKQIIKENFEENKTLIESQFELIDLQLKQIIDQTTNTIGRVGKLETEIISLKENEIKHNLACPQLSKIQYLEKEIERSKNVKKFLLALLATAGGIIGLIVGLDKIFKIF